MVSVAAHHAEWLSLVDVSGPFLSVPVLKEALPNGLDAHDPHVAAEVRAALEQWTDPDGVGLGSVDEVEVHLAFVRFVLHEVLGFDDDVLRWDSDAASAWVVEVPQVGVLTPDAVVVDGDDAAMLVSVVGPGVRVDEIIAEIGTLTAQARMVEHLKATGLRVGLVTDGERWTLVSFQEGENPGLATWWSSLWAEEKVTLQAFRTLLHQDRFVSMGADETIAGLLDRSAEDQREVTTKLGNQTLDAVEILIRTIDRIDHERGGALLAEVPVEELYDAAVTVMMRLIFLFYAEENDLLPVDEPLYNDRYAASTLRERLQAAADEHGEEVLESTRDGWPRLLASWRAVFGGVEHGDMVLAPYGGSLFDPDRYPFLEGRQPGTTWTTDPADPLPIDNRTVLHLLNALQTLDEGGQRRKLSFRALDVEQIGHVYEGMLDHTAARANGWVLGLSGTGGREPEIELDHLESFDDKALFDFLKEQTGRSPATLKKWVDDDEADNAVTKFGITWAATFADAEFGARARRFAKLIRPDSTGAPSVFQPGSVYVADSSHRGATGTHYTPRSLTEEIVKHTLEPLVYIGPADGTAEDEWKLRTPEEILDLKICDPACGSGAFLVQACRYLADAIVEASRAHQRRSDRITEDEIIDARRQVAERCLHGVDINPMACEMAKLSLWLITLAHDRPFTFLDHAIRNGDSIIGIASLEQLEAFRLEPAIESSQPPLGWPATISERIEQSCALRDSIRKQRTSSVSDLHLKQLLEEEADSSLLELRRSADALVDTYMKAASKGHLRQLLCERELAIASDDANFDIDSARNPFHWPLEYPDVMHGGGFSAILGNPPFLGGYRVTTEFGDDYLGFVRRAFDMPSNRVNLAAAFFRRAAQIASQDSSIGLIGPAVLSSTDTRDGGLRVLLGSGWTISRAKSGFEWPTASTSVTVVIVWLNRTWQGRVVLDDQVVEEIDSGLRPGPEVGGEPLALSENVGLAYFGSRVGGEKKGFILDEQTAQRIRSAGGRSASAVWRCLNGQDINDSKGEPEGRPILHFGEISLSELKEFGPAYDWAYEVIRPPRLELDAQRYKRIVDGWWKYFHPRLKLYEGIREKGLDRVLVRSEVSSYNIVLPVETANTVFLHKLIVWVSDSDTEYGLLQSSVHEVFTEDFGKSGGTIPSYLPSRSSDRLPRPPNAPEVGEAAMAFHLARLAVCHERDLGLRSVHKLMDDPRERGKDVVAVRGEFERLDYAAVGAYGWDSLLLDHGHHDAEGRTYFGLSAATRRRLSSLLLQLNLERSSSG